MEKDTKIKSRSSRLNGSTETILKYSLIIGVSQLLCAVFFFVWFALSGEENKLMMSLTFLIFAFAAGGPGFWRKLRPGDWS